MGILWSDIFCCSYSDSKLTSSKKASSKELLSLPYLLSEFSDLLWPISYPLLLNVPNMRSRDLKSFCLYSPLFEQSARPKSIKEIYQKQTWTLVSHISLCEIPNRWSSSSRFDNFIYITILHSSIGIPFPRDSNICIGWSGRHSNNQN